MAATRTTHNHIDPHALDSLLNNTLHLHHSFLPNTDSTTGNGRTPPPPPPASHHRAFGLGPSALVPSSHLPDSVSKAQSPVQASAPAPGIHRQRHSRSLSHSHSRPWGAQSRPGYLKPTIHPGLKHSVSVSSTSSSFSSADSAGIDETGMETPLTASAMTSPTRSIAPTGFSFETQPFSQTPSSPPPPVPLRHLPRPQLRGSPRPPPPSDHLDYYSSLFFASCATSPTSTVTPTSPLKVAFSSRRNHRHDPSSEPTTTFASYYNQLSPNSKYCVTQQQQQQQQEHDVEQPIDDILTFHNTENMHGSPLRNDAHIALRLPQPVTPPSLLGSPRSPRSPQSPHQHQQQVQYDYQTNDTKQPFARHSKTSMGAMSNSSFSISNDNHGNESHNAHYSQHHHQAFVDHGSSNPFVKKSPGDSPVDRQCHHQHQKLDQLQHQHEQTSCSNNSNGPRITTASTSVIPIHVRYVPKDLWVQVDLPRDIPVHKARDLILAKCRLTSMPPQPQTQAQAQAQALLQQVRPPLVHSTTHSASASGTDSEVTLTENGILDQDFSSLNLDAMVVRGSASPDPNSKPFHPVDSSISNPLAYDGSSTLTLHSSDDASAPASRSRRPSRSSELNDETFDDQESIGDEEAEMQAEELMADDTFPDSPIVLARSSLGYGNDEITPSMMQELREGTSGKDSALDKTNPSPRALSRQQSIQQSSHESCLSNTSSAPSNIASVTHGEHAALNQQQLQQLISYSSLHRSNSSSINYSGSSASAGRRNSCSKDGCNAVTRLSQNIPVWSAYRSRQSSNSARQMVREVLDHGGMLADCLDGDTVPKTETRKSECSAWKACFGLFWVAAGHWLDDSRLVSSYNLQPHCLFELQLRNNYIQLPPPGSLLSYYDHYAEGVLYKMSKKNRPVTKFTGHGNRDCASAANAANGVWKERWVVLQGNKLMIYHKRKDTTKKSIELLIPLTVLTTVIPHSPRHSFKLTSSSAPMSTTMITLTVSPDPCVPKVCLRATSESELNHWVRIFNSMNSTPIQGTAPPPFDHPTTAMFSCVSPMAPPIAVPPPLPPLPFEPPPISPGGTSTPCSPRKRDRHHSYTASATSALTYSHILSGSGVQGFSAERKRSHTSHTAVTLPAINPVLISNAAAAFSNLNLDSEGSIGDESDIGGSDIMRWSGSNSRRGSSGGVHGSPGQSALLRRGRARTTSQTSIVGSLLNGRDLSQLQHHPLSLSRQGSVLFSGSGGEFHQRQRTITEPGQLGQGPRFRSTSSGMSSQRSSQQMLLKDYLQRSLRVSTPEPVSDITGLHESTADTDGQDPTSALDSTSLALLKSSNARSSAAPLYSGYIWLYVPNTSQDGNTASQSSSRPSTPPVSKSNSIFSFANGAMGAGAGSGAIPTFAPAMSKSSSCSSIMSPRATLPSGAGRAANISATKATGRYVKCFVAVNAMGQFQWVEVKRDRQPEAEDQDAETDTAASPGYGIRLSPKVTSTVKMDTTLVGQKERPAISDKMTSINMARSESTRVQRGQGPRGEVQVSMAHKLRLYFFCIKISLSSLAEVMIDMTDMTDLSHPSDSRTTGSNAIRPQDPASPTSSLPPPLTEKSSLRVRSTPNQHKNRFSAPLTHQKTLSMSSSTVTPLPLPSRAMSLQKSRTRTTNGTPSPPYSLRRDRNPTITTSGPLWPSMTLLHGRSSPSSPQQQQQQQQPQGREEAAQTPIPPPERLISQTFSIMTPKRTTSSASVSGTKSPVSTPATTVLPAHDVARSLLVKTKSLFVENRTRSAPPGSILLAPASVGSTREHAHEAGKLERHSSPLANTLGRSKGTLYLPAEEQEKLGGGVSPVAGNFSMEQKETEKERISQVMSLAGHLQKALSQNRSFPEDDSRGKALRNHEQELKDHEKEMKPLSLQEITAKKRASLQKIQDAANVEAARMKLVGGASRGGLEVVRESMEEMKDDQPEQSQRQRVRERDVLPTRLRALLLQCPFLEQGEMQKDVEGRWFVTLKGYTETEDAWKMLQSALERFLDGPIKDQRSALPPEDTLIPSYHAPKLPEIRLSEKAQNFLRAKDRAAAAAAAATSVSAIAGAHSSSSADNLSNGLNLAHSGPTAIAAAAVATFPSAMMANTGLSRSNNMAATCATNLGSDTGLNSTGINSGPIMSGTPVSGRNRTVTTPAVFNRHSIPLASGVGYGPRRSFVGVEDRDKTHSSSINSCQNEEYFQNQRYQTRSNIDLQNRGNNCLFNRSCSPVAGSSFLNKNQSCGGHDSGRTRTHARHGSSSGLLLGSGAVMPSPAFKLGHQRTGSGSLLRGAGPSKLQYPCQLQFQFQPPQQQQQRQLPRPQPQCQHCNHGHGHGPIAQIKATGASLTRWMHISYGGGSGGSGFSHLCCSAGY